MDDQVNIRAAIFASPSAVYRALTSHQPLLTWFAELVECCPDNGKFAFWGRHTPFGDVPRQRLESVTSGIGLSFAWEVDGMDTVVDLRVYPTSTGDTTLVLSHIPVPSWGFDRASMNDFWGIAVGNLANFTEGRALAPRPDYTDLPVGQALARIHIEKPRQQVFDVLVDPGLIDRWLPSAAIVEPRVGGRYEFGWDHGPVELIAFDPPDHLAYTWHNDGWPDTEVHWDLADSDDGTLVTVRHQGFVDGRPADGYQLGWQNLLIGLQRMLEIGDRWTPFEWRHR